VPGSIVLGLWSSCLAVAAGLLCYAVATSLDLGVAICATVLAAGLWWGPYASRVRGPVNRVLHPLARTGRRWLAATVVLATVAGGVGWVALDRGTDWAPDDSPPLSSLFR
jgi:hypothetical protein